MVYLGLQAAFGASIDFPTTIIPVLLLVLTFVDVTVVRTATLQTDLHGNLDVFGATYRWCWQSSSGTSRREGRRAR